MKKRLIVLARSEPKSCGAKLVDMAKRRGNWKWTCVLAILIGVTVAAEAAEPKRILLLHSYSLDFSPFSEFAQGFRAELDRQFKEPVDVYEFSLASARFANEDLDLDRPFAEYLRTLFHDHKLDLVVTIGAPAADFFQKYRQQLSPATPMIITFIEQRRVSVTNLTANDIVVSNRVDFAGVVDNILRILPKTNNGKCRLGQIPCSLSGGLTEDHCDRSSAYRQLTQHSPDVETLGPYADLTINL